MEYLNLRKEGAVFVITMDNHEKQNAITMDMLREFNELFDEIENTPGNAALVIDTGSPKFWCTGIDLQWLSGQSDDGINGFLYEFKRTFLRVSLLNLPTVGCLNGHAFAGGAILAAAMDFRYMRDDRAKFCLPEVTYSMPLGDALIAVIGNIPAPAAVQHLVLTGEAWKGEQCLRNGVVSAIYPGDQLFNRSLEFAEELASKDRKNYTGLKYDLKPGLLNMWRSQNIR